MVKYNRKTYKRKNFKIAGVPKPSSVITKPKKTTKASIQRNAVSVYTLAKQVKQLKMSQVGEIQRNFQNLVADFLIPTAKYPLLLDTTDFSCFRAIPGPGLVAQGAQVYQNDGLGNIIPVSGFNVQDWFNNPFWSRQNTDLCDTGKYLPVWAKYTIRIEGDRALDNTRVRFDLFSANAKAIVPGAGAAPATNVILPSALVHMNDMANPVLNRLNPTYFKRYRTKTKFMNSSKTDPNVKGTTANIQYYTFTIHPKKMKYQATSQPDNPQDPSPEIQDGNFGPLNIPVDSPLWLMISTDDLTATASDRVKINISRECKWRDGLGSAFLY